VGNVTATIDTRRVASIRIRADEPAGVDFFSHATGRRIDLLFEFPVSAQAIAKAAVQMKIRGHVFAVASAEDLLRLKTMAKPREPSRVDL